MCAMTGVLTASGSSSEYAWLEAVARVLTVAAPIGVGLFALHRPPFERFGALLVVAGRRVVPHDAGQRRRRDPLQRRAGRAVDVRAAADLPAAGVPDRPAGTPRRPGAGRAAVAARAGPLPADGAAGRALPGARALDELRRRLPGERVHGQRIGAGVHRGPRAAAARDPHGRAVRRGRGAARAAPPRRDPARPPRPRSRAGRGVLPRRGVRRRCSPAGACGPSRGPRGVGLAARPSRCRWPRSRSSSASRAGGCSSPGRRQRLAARLRAPLPPGGPAGRARRGVRRSVAGDRLLAGQRRGALGRCGRAPGRGRRRRRRDAR